MVVFIMLNKWLISVDVFVEDIILSRVNGIDEN